MLRNHRFVASALAVAFMGTILATPMAARASEEGKRNTAIGLGAASAALLLTQKNKLPGILAGAGAIYAYSQYEHDINKRHARERARAYRTGYRRGVSYARYHRSRYHRTRRHHR
ncbi:MAG TPA: hypothetical protein VFB21_04530 [Chthonomonadaceae bacterium]|nr:hypothetical protein [Chthonomonadaceae bacterium]